MEKRYIVINNKDIWCIENESDTYYEIHTRDTWDRVNKNDVYVRQGSSLYWYTGDSIEIYPSNIEIESEEEYQEWLEKENKNIDPFKMFEEVDWGMNEPDSYGNEKWDLYWRTK
jgi:hypothetical protein